ncbi:hypothetical protein HHK36_000287 [Tetracentron sinense]|uniref:1-acylglycerophosphocholine O-acyltransferase n=1 Tax=Tetracentron sinense TaxID=13715 RepID=A0A835A0Q7_TETSI|nr:hypothetical protein HHK36_000287 [Tetracentron sinense]
MESMASAIGISVSVLRFLLCFVATVPVSFLCRFIPGTLPKHLYSAASGALLSYLSFGFSSNLHFLVPMLMGYASMLLYRQRCGIITFFTGFGYLIGWSILDLFDLHFNSLDLDFFKLLSFRWSGGSCLSGSAQIVQHVLRSGRESSCLLASAQIVQYVLRSGREPSCLPTSAQFVQYVLRSGRKPSCLLLISHRWASYLPVLLCLVTPYPRNDSNPARRYYSEKTLGHVYYMSGDAWKEGGIDATGPTGQGTVSGRQLLWGVDLPKGNRGVQRFPQAGRRLALECKGKGELDCKTHPSSRDERALMVLTLKVISCAINYNDGLLKEEGLREAQKKNRLLQLPSLIEYFGYCLCCGSHFAGPVYEMKDYFEWTERKGIWSRSEKGPSPSPYGATVRALVQAAVCMGLYLYLVPHFPLSRFTDSIYQEWGFWKRLAYQYMSGFTARWKYYFIWSISEASIIISGLGFSGWTDSSPPKPRWDRAKNVDILGVELAKSAVQLPLVWNIQVSTWLRYYVYERLIQKGKKPGFFQLLATQTVSAVWHGLYPGYIIFFVQSALMIAGSRVTYRWQQAIPQNMELVRKILALANFAYTLLVLNYSCVGFLVLSMHETLSSYGSVYYIGTIVPVVLILLGCIIKPAKPARSKARKEQ